MVLVTTTITLSCSSLLHYYSTTRTRYVVVRCTRSSSNVVQEIDEKSENVFHPLKVAKRVVLVRHGQSTWNAEGRIQGSSDFSVLTKKGESQAETSRQMLFDDNFDACFSRVVLKLNADDPPRDP
ncbi:2,3-bisphosphoglycerate-dependent phosphoglycerate mutase, partial [Trifolium pratense]